MADTKISNLTALAAAPDSGDFFALVDTSAAETKKLDAKYLVRDSAGSGAIVTGAYTLTIPATGTAALLGTANNFTQPVDVTTNIKSDTPGSNFIFSFGLTTAANFGFRSMSDAVTLVLDRQTGATWYSTLAIRRDNGHVLLNTTTDSGQLTVLANSTSTVGLVVDTAASTTAAAQQWMYNGTEYANLTINAAQVFFRFNNRDHGSNYGPMVYIGRNSNASTPSSGFVRITNINNTDHFVWPDTSGNLRIGSIYSPSNAYDTSGTVVGTQTSTLASKILLGDDLTPGAALRTILETPVKHFKYKSNAYNGSDFHGIVADYSPEFAMDEGRVFNPVSAVGYLIQAIKALTERIQQLEAA